VQSFFARDPSPGEETPERAVADREAAARESSPQLLERDIRRLLDKREDQAGPLLNAPRAPVAAQSLRSGVALCALQSAPADRTRRAHAKLVQGDDDLTIATGNQNVTIAMNQTSKYGMCHSLTVGMSETNTIGMSQTNTISMSQTNTIGMSQTTLVGTSVTIIAPVSITLISGGSTVLINPAGVQILAPTFAVVAPGGAAIKGATIPLVS
jgi:Bacteriophage T4 gp5 C-terminal trimerisation domain